MFKYKLYQKILTILGAIAFGLLITPSFVPRGQAQSDSDSSLTPVAQQSSTQSGNAFEPDNDAFEPVPLGAPERTADAGTRGRGSCGELGLTFLLEKDLEKSKPEEGKVVYTNGITVSDHPTFLWYWNPQNLKNAKIKTATFVLIPAGKDERDIHMTEHLPVNTSGIIKLPVPTSQPPLENGKWYEWFVNIAFEGNIPICNQTAFIQHRVLTAEKQQELNSLTTAEERFDFYSQHGIWYDALATLHELRRENPDDQDLNKLWSQTLESIQLSELADQPLVETTQIAGDLEETPNP